MKKRSTRTSIMLLALFLIVAGCMPLFLKKQYYTNLMVQVLINIIIVTGLNFITGLTGQMNLGTAGIFALGAYTSALGKPGAKARPQGVVDAHTVEIP